MVKCKGLRWVATVIKIKYRILRWVDRVIRMEEVRSPFKIITATPTGKRPLGSLGLDGKTLLEWILKK